MTILNAIKMGEHTYVHLYIYIYIRDLLRQLLTFCFSLPQKIIKTRKKKPKQTSK